jgi:L-aminopeptidase/D-esterase-like protein
MTISPDSVCDVPGTLVGHAQDDVAKTGCTVIVPKNGAVAGVDVRGSAPGTREIETLRPVRLVPRIHALLFTGGSAFGLDAAGGVQQYLEENKVGYDVGVTKVPIVPAAVIFDLAEGDAFVRPDKTMGYEAAQRATTVFPGSGRCGAGCGATVGKLLGPQQCQKGGIGTAGLQISDIWIGVLVVVNALGDIIDPESGDIIAGVTDPESGEFADSMKLIREQNVQPLQRGSNTTLVAVVTDASLNKDDITKVAQMAQDGLSRCIRPAHTPYDGDIVFGLSVGDKQNTVGTMALGALAADLVAESVLRAVRSANA